jgi:lipoprotein-anchoring transpeptidase ErfK/SrfK
MKRFVLIALLSALFLSLQYNTGLTAETSMMIAHRTAEQSVGGSRAKVLCLPGIYTNLVSDCQADGPSTYLTELAQQNVTFPTPPLPGVAPDFNLTYANVAYGQVRKNKAPIYGSIDDAVHAKTKNAVQWINASFSYISYTDETVVDGIRLYMVSPGAWMTANDVIRVTAPRFQGLTFTETPRLDFGWVLTYLSQTPYVETKKTPGYQNNDYTGRHLNNHDLVWVYQTEKIDDFEWYMVGPDEWVHQNVVARVNINTTPPTGVPSNRWIEINLFEQTIAAYDNNQLVFATLIASGLEPFWTRPGLFQIYEKLDSTPMSGSFEADHSDAYYLEDVPWTMYFDERRAIHGAYWRANLGFVQSHGCVNMSIGDAQWIYDWANIGDWVYVWDPSGRTPTDPVYYTAGGA